MNAFVGRALAGTAFALVVAGLSPVPAPDGAAPTDRTGHASGSVPPPVTGTTADGAGFRDGAAGDAAGHVVRTVDPSSFGVPLPEPSRTGPIYL